MMNNFIIKESKLTDLSTIHENDNDIKRYFDDEFQINQKWLQPAKIFKLDIPDLIPPKQSWLNKVFSSIGGKQTLGSEATENDLENGIKLFESLNIHPVQACDPRLWAYLCHGPYYSFIKKRFHPNKDFKHYKIEEYYEYSDEIKKIIKNFIKARFFTTTDNRTLRRNGIASLWWSVYLTCSPWDRWSDIDKKDDKYYYTKMVLEPGTTDLFSSIFERTLGKEARIVFPMFDIIKSNQLNRNESRSLIKKINSELTFRKYSMLSSTELIKALETLL